MATERDENPNPYVSPASPPRGRDRWDWEPLVPGEVLRVEGVLAPKDLFLANNLKAAQKPGDAITLAVVFFMIFLGTAIPAVIEQRGFVYLAAVFLALAIGFGSVGFPAARRIDRYWRDKRGVFQFRQIEISEEGIRQQSEDSSAEYRWDVFGTYTATKRVVMLEFDPPEGYVYHFAFGQLLIPREFFLCDADWNRFVRLVRRKLPKTYRWRAR